MELQVFQPSPQAIAIRITSFRISLIMDLAPVGGVLRIPMHEKFIFVTAVYIEIVLTADMAFRSVALGINELTAVLTVCSLFYLPQSLNNNGLKEKSFKTWQLL